MTDMVNLKINGVPVSVPNGSTILEAARHTGIHIPTLCYLREINEIGACRICVVEVKGARSLVASCVHPAMESMEVFTNSPIVRDSRKTTLQLLLSNHDKQCLACIRNQSCELQKLCSEYCIDDLGRFAGASQNFEIDDTTGYIVRDNNKCILCRRCVAVCANQHVSVIGAHNRGFDTTIGCAFEKDLADVSCIACGQCTSVCPTGALVEKDFCAEVLQAIADPQKHVVVNTAPAIRVTLGECFGLPAGTNVKGKMVAALRRLGFDMVFDTNFGADLTIMEEAHEFIGRVKNGGVLPMITSCSPGWVKFCEHYYPEFLPNLSSCKSPLQMTGAIIKTWYASKNKIDPRDIVVVGVMPCTAKKFEVHRDHQSAAGLPDTDIVLTTRELARLIKNAHIDFLSLPDEHFDPALGVSAGAAAIFGATGGVMESALRTVADVLTGRPSKSIEYQELRGTQSLKQFVYDIAGMQVKGAVVSGMREAAKLLDRVKSGECSYHFIEVMGCLGGCVNGGGQPIQPADVRNFEDLGNLRAQALYREDKSLEIRKSYQSPLITMIYKDFLGEPGSHKAHQLLHTSYVKRQKY